jgi:hypothetical protein
MLHIKSKVLVLNVSLLSNKMLNITYVVIVILPRHVSVLLYSLQKAVAIFIIRTPNAT